ncbi:MAG: TIGR03013 family PEP-CTERM/XrtA system glycosyltransferase [Nitrospirae bacterium]|nr:TIGR03013 family PEP-CTERM/XrtA system glycosyltransferase [Candidatus Manganitrophaceae bacterium]
MFRLFNRYYSIKHTFYFAFENILIVLFLVWGTVIDAVWVHLLLAPLICQLVLYYSDLFPPFPRFSIKEFLVKHLKAMLWAAGILFLCYLIIPPPSTEDWSALWWRLALFPLLIIGLRFGYQTLSITRHLDTPILIIGSGTVATILKDYLVQDRNLGYRIFHFQWDLGTTNKTGDQLEHLSRFVKRQKIKQVVVALRDRRGQLPVKSLLHLRVQGIEVFEAVSFYERIAGKIRVDWLKPSTLIFSEGFNRMHLIRVTKRVSDILFSVIGLIVSLPVFLVIPLMIKLTSKGPIFYRQERVGERGQPFMVMKFRSMREDAEVASGPVWAQENDPRVTALGKIMRTLRIDEIPQMINVLRGEMSFVGPRPERELFVKQLREKIPYYDLRYTVKPGLTGWAQVKYRYGATEQDALEKLQYDLYYIKHLSPIFDLTIVIDTIRVVLLGSGAR